MSKDQGEHCSGCGAHPDNIITIWHYDFCYHPRHKKYNFGGVWEEPEVTHPNRRIEHKWCKLCRCQTVKDSCNHRKEKTK